MTGELSDLAGVAMIAILLTALIGRTTGAVVPTGAAFALLETVPEVVPPDAASRVG